MNTHSSSGKIAAFGFGVAMLSMTSIVHASDLEIAPGLVLVPDPTLAVMRGKFVASTTQVVYFGVQMQSNWATPDGSMLNAGANISVNLSTSTPNVSFHPTVNFVAAENGDQFTDTSARTVTNAGVDNVSGITQSVQTTGDYNHLGNLAKLNFLSEIPTDEGPANGTNTASFEYNNGAVSMSGESTLDDNSVLVHLQIDGQGVAEQSIRGTIQDSTGKGVYQTIMALGDRQQITNQMDMNVVVRNASETAVLQQGMGASINNLRGLTPNH